MTPHTTVEDDGAMTRSEGLRTLAWKAAVFLLAALGCTELLWRGLGYAPPGSQLVYFAALRKEADENPKAVAMIGSSRVRWGLDPVAIGRAVPGRKFLQLGIAGFTSMPALYDLAGDPNFKGLVICEFHTSHFLGPYTYPKLPNALAYSHPEFSGAYIEQWLGEQVRMRFSFFSYTLVREIPRLLQHEPPPAKERPDRYYPFKDPGPEHNRHLEYVYQLWMGDSAAQLARSGAWQTPPEMLGWLAKIRQRGGDVAFVRMPVGGALREQEKKFDAETQSLIHDLRARGNILIDYSEQPEQFHCPEGLHLDAASAEKFSRTLGQQLAAKGFFR